MTRFALLLIALIIASCTVTPDQPAHKKGVDALTLAAYRPQSVYNIPSSRIEKAAFPVIDMHTHDYAESQQEIDQCVETMKKAGIARSVILSTQTGEGFDAVVKKYAMYPKEFEIWCGIDFTGYDTDPNWVDHAIAELERCHKLGAKGVGELGDKGEGLLYSNPTPGYGIHLDDPQLIPYWAKCAELGMPVNIHVAEPIWMYEKMDSTNDGLMNAWEWAVDLSKEGILDHGGLMKTLENAVAANPRTTFIACHFANCSHDLGILGKMLDAYPNLWADISARYAETAPIPRHVKSFYEKYQDRLLYGTDMGTADEMYQITFRILESNDEHFYANDQFGYHWPLNGFGLSKEVLEQVYHKNAEKLYNSL